MMSSSSLIRQLTSRSILPPRWGILRKRLMAFIIFKCDVIKQNESEVEKYDFWFFGIFYTRVLFKLQFGENTTEIVQLVPNIQTAEGWKQKKLSALFGCILKRVFVRSDSFCLITSHIRTVEK